MKKKNVGTSFDSWLEEEGIRQEVTAGVHQTRAGASGRHGDDTGGPHQDGDGAANADQPQCAESVAGCRKCLGHPGDAAEGGHGHRARSTRGTGVSPHALKSEHCWNTPVSRRVIRQTRGTAVPLPGPPRPSPVILDISPPVILDILNRGSSVFIFIFVAAPSHGASFVWPLPAA